MEDCSLDDVGFISCVNVLNESIHPVPGRSNSDNDFLKIMGWLRYLIFADLSSSYFQVYTSKLTSLITFFKRLQRQAERDAGGA